MSENMSEWILDEVEESLKRQFHRNASRIVSRFDEAHAKACVLSNELAYLWGLSDGKRGISPSESRAVMDAAIKTANS